MNNSILDHRGYSIPITHPDVEKHKRKLKIAPKEDTNLPYKIDKSFPVYREDSERFYMPKFYGTKNYGKPDVNQECKGLEIDITFKGKLYENQIMATNKCKEAFRKKGGGLLQMSCGMGKCLGLGTLVMLYDGTTINVEDLVVGNVIMGDDSTPRTILSLARGKEQMYQIEQDNGMTYNVNKSHVMTVYDLLEDTIVDISLQELVDNGVKRYKGVRCKVDFPFVPVLMDPYKMGYWLGSKDVSSCYFIKTDSNGNIQDDVIMSQLLKYKALNKEHIPLEYFLNTKSIRLELVKGYKDSGMNSSNNIRQEMNELCVSLGIDLFDNNEKEFTLTNISITSLQKDYYYGFEIDGNGRFLLGDCTVTHNTTCAIELMCHLNRKTLVIVHKELLLNQWIERIQQYAPNARIGVIQGTTCDTTDKDIVIGMIQSLSQKDYPQEIFNEFGFLCVDEAHHLMAKIFSKVLYKCCPKYKIGLSATPERKDGLTFAIEWFMGKIIVQIKRETEAMVRFVPFKDPNSVERFNKFGKINFAAMINDLTVNEKRNQLIIDQIKQLRKDGRTVVVMTSRRSHCELIQFMLDEPSGLFYSGLKKSVMEENIKHDIIIATYQIFKEGTDIPKLNTLVMATPEKDIEQSVGRILRGTPVITPLIVDIVDKFSIFTNQARIRKKFYREVNYINETGESLQPKPKKKKECMFTF